MQNLMCTHTRALKNIVYPQPPNHTDKHTFAQRHAHTHTHHKHTQHNHTHTNPHTQHTHKHKHTKKSHTSENTHTHTNRAVSWAPSYSYKKFQTSPRLPAAGRLFEIADSGLLERGSVCMCVCVYVHVCVCV